MSGIILSIAAFIAVITAFEVEIERPEVEFYDKEFFKYMNASVRRVSRKSPIVNFDMYVLKTMGDNFTVIIKLLENLSGRYQPTFVMMEWKMCEFLAKEPYLGQMIAKQLSPELSCPFKPGLARFPSLVITFDKFPYTLPFTWIYKTISVRLDITFCITSSKQAIGKANFYAKIKLDTN